MSARSVIDEFYCAEIAVSTVICDSEGEILSASIDNHDDVTHGGPYECTKCGRLYDYLSDLDGPDDVEGGDEQYG